MSHRSPTHRLRARRAFTLLELIVVLVVLGLVAAIGIPTYNRVVIRTELTTAELSLGNMSRRAFAAAKLANTPITPATVTETAAATQLQASAEGTFAAGTWSVDFDPNGHSSVFGSAHAAISAAGDTLGMAVHGPTVGCAYSRYTVASGDTWSDASVEAEQCNAITALTGDLPEDVDPATSGFELTGTGGDSTISLSWPSQGGATEYTVRCWTANLTEAGDTPKTVAAAGGDTQAATVNFVENFVVHTCEVDAVTPGGSVTSDPADVTPFVGPTLSTPPPGVGPPGLPPEGPEPANPAAPLPTPAACTASSRPAQCLTATSDLAGLASFVSAHSGNHNVYTVDRGANALRAISDSGARSSSSHLIAVVGAGGAPVGLTNAVDLVAGRHPSRLHPHGPSPYSSLYAATSDGDIWLISPISGASTWRGYQVADNVGTTTSVVYDNCPTAPGAADRAPGSHCLHVTTGAGVVVVPLTSTTSVAMESAWAAQGPAGAAAVASNTTNGASGSGSGSWWTTSGANVNRHAWSGAGQPHSPAPTGAELTAASGIAWMSGSFWVTDTAARQLVRFTPSGNTATRTVIAGAPSTPISLDGVGAAARFTNPTRVHWHGNTPNLYVLDGPCVRRVNTDSGAVTSLVCPAEWQSTNLERVDTPEGSPVFSPSSAGSMGYTGIQPLFTRLTADGATAYFTSTKSLVPEDVDVNGWDVYSRNFDTGEVTLISNGLAGAPNESLDVAVSADGSKVLLTGAPSGRVLFLYDVATGTYTELLTNGSRISIGGFTPDGSKLSVAVSNNGFAMPGITPIPGRVSTFHDFHVYVYDLAGNSWVRASEDAAGVAGADGSAVGTACTPGGLSADGNKVVFACGYQNLVAGDTNAQPDVFVKNLADGTIVRANLSAAGAEANAASHMPGITPDGLTAVFVSAASNLVADDTNGVVDVFVKNLSSGAISRITAPGGAQLTSGSGLYALNQTGTRLAFRTSESFHPADNGHNDVYAVDLAGTGHTWLSSTGLGTGGAWLNANGDINDIAFVDGRIAYTWRHGGPGYVLATRAL